MKFLRCYFKLSIAIQSKYACRFSLFHSILLEGGRARGVVRSVQKKKEKRKKKRKKGEKKEKTNFFWNSSINLGYRIPLPLE